MVSKSDVIANDNAICPSPKKQIRTKGIANTKNMLINNLIEDLTFKFILKPFCKTSSSIFLRKTCFKKSLN